MNAAKALELHAAARHMLAAVDELAIWFCEKHRADLPPQFYETAMALEDALPADAAQDEG